MERARHRLRSRSARPLADQRSGAAARPRCGPAAVRCRRGVRPARSRSRTPGRDAGRRPRPSRGSRRGGRRTVRATAGRRPHLDRRAGGGGYGGGDQSAAATGAPLERRPSAAARGRRPGRRARRRRGRRPRPPPGRTVAAPLAGRLRRRRPAACRTAGAGAGQHLDPARLVVAGAVPDPGRERARACGPPACRARRPPRRARSSGWRRCAWARTSAMVCTPAAAARPAPPARPSPCATVVGPVAVTGRAHLGRRRHEPGQAAGLQRQQRVLDRAVVVGDHRVAARCLVAGQPERVEGERARPRAPPPPARSGIRARGPRPPSAP